MALRQLPAVAWLFALRNCTRRTLSVSQSVAAPSLSLPLSLFFLPSHLITLYSPFGSSPFSMMRASSSSLGNSRHNAMRMCTNAAVGPPCVHSARSVPPRASSSRPSWGASVQRRSLAPVANLMPSFAKFPTCQAYKCEIAISFRHAQAYNIQYYFARVWLGLLGYIYNGYIVYNLVLYLELSAYGI